ncbi:MAG: hypothetical protein QG604_43 [Candidatus Dependentiae bacterium]|nr:hypothetical protein [Candidatus Dependentiae bacterium]
MNKKVGLFFLLGLVSAQSAYAVGGMMPDPNAGMGGYLNKFSSFLMKGTTAAAQATTGLAMAGGAMAGQLAATRNNLTTGLQAGMQAGMQAGAGGVAGAGLPVAGTVPVAGGAMAGAGAPVVTPSADSSAADAQMAQAQAQADAQAKAAQDKQAQQDAATATDVANLNATAQATAQRAEDAESRDAVKASNAALDAAFSLPTSSDSGDGAASTVGIDGSSAGGSGVSTDAGAPL